MKVMHVIHGLNTGGAETLVKEYALKLDKKKFDVTVLCMNRINNSPFEKLLKDNNINVIYISDYQKNYNKKGMFFKIINIIQKYMLVKKIIHKEMPDILHTHLPINNYIKFSKPKKGTKIIHTVHNEPKYLWPKNNSKRQKDLNAANWLVKNYNMRFIVLHDEMKNEINTMFGVNNSIVLNNGIDFYRFENVKDKNEKRKELNIPNNAFVIGHIGRFNYQKNHEFLIKVFAEIYKKNKSSFLLMIGTGEEKERIISKLDELGLKNNYLILENRMDIPDLLNVMDVFMFPSRYEGLGIALIEAQKMNLPCFISDRVPKSAIISNLVTKLSLDLSPSEWANIILEYELPQNICLNDKDWDMKEVIRKLENIYLDKI